MEARHLTIVSLMWQLSAPEHAQGALVNKVVDDAAQSVERNSSLREVSSNTSELCREWGYTPEEHRVTTADGYILAVSRIRRAGPPVLVMHGLLNSADDWLTAGGSALPFLLADRGYDVFLGNVRGNKYSREHVRLSSADRAFWNFTFHEIGFYDLPAIIDYVLETSNKSQVTYIGQSQGTTVFFVMASLKPDYNAKVSLMVSMATIAWLSHLRSPVLRTFVPLRYQEAFLVESLGIYEVLAYRGFLKLLTTRFCPSSKFSLFICVSALFSVYGFDYGQLDHSRLAAEIGHLPGGASIKQLLHFAQLIHSGAFRQFDYNSKDANMRAYGQEEPPPYPIETITVPTAIMSGDNDLISSQEDVTILMNKHSNIIEQYKVSDPKFNHMDFLWARDAGQLVYRKVLELIKTFGTI